jgi:putative selenate reductase
MAEKFAPLAAGPLLAWILAEEQRGQVFGIHRELFFKPRASDPFRMRRFGHLLETPLGVAAGPHTQLAQNIVAAWLCGARYIELKTVQTLDRLEVRKPCIAVSGAGYNCEWSQELTLDESFDQYLAAWVLLHALKRRFKGPFRGDAGFIFNFSVGYDLAGIMQPNMQRFFDRISLCRSEKEALLLELEPLYPAIREIDIPECISDSVTLSTMHGCPPEEIEKIALYLLNERKLHTTVKLNPTLLGPAALRGLLNGTLGWKVRVPDQAFAHDLKYDAALGLLRRLQACADHNGLNFGVKLTNTLECLNDRGLLPAAEKTVYMSGRPLQPLAIALARRLQNDFAGKLDISFSAGVDAFNAAELLACGLKPLTVCSDILQPGGYTRLPQYLKEIAGEMAACEAASLDDLVLKRAKIEDPAQAVMKNLENCQAALEKDDSFRAPHFAPPSFKGKRALDWFDCAAAPCREECAIGQDVSRYMHWVGKGDSKHAAAVIWETNPLPAVCGMVCDQKCRSRCTRGLYDQALAIRAIKRFAVKNGKPQLDAPLPNKLRAAVIGAGPSGLAAARDLARSGFWVEVFEANSFAGGLAATVIPGFRLGASALNEDVARLKKLGVVFRFNETVDGLRLRQLLDAFDFVYLACGAGRGQKMLLAEEEATGVYDALEFLAALKRGEEPALGGRVVVIGGGNSAMDAARSARRLGPADAQVTVIYRRSLAEMPAAAEEIEAALAEGVAIRELSAPLGIQVDEGRAAAVRCARMELKEKDESGRRRPVPVFGSEFELPCDAVIVAIGQEKKAAPVDGWEWGAVGEDGRTKHPYLFVGGDARAGASTLIKAVADGRRVAKRIAEIIDKAGNAENELPLASLTWLEHQLLRARRDPPAGDSTAKPAAPAAHLGGKILAAHPAPLPAKAAVAEAGRCLHCDDFCQLCVSVCPNRALVGFATVPGRYPILSAVRESSKVEMVASSFLEIRQKYQLVHVADFCNACGNCATFCPTADVPYKDKPHFYLHKKEFDQAVDGFFLEPPRHEGMKVLRARVGGEPLQMRQFPDLLEFENNNCQLKLQRGDLSFLGANWRKKADPVFDGELLASMAVLLEFLPPFLYGDKADV